MKREKLVEAAEDLNVILFNAEKKDEGWVYAVENNKELEKTIKEAAMWLVSSDELKENTVEVLKSMEWTTDDFLTLAESQDPFPLLRKYAIYDDQAEVKEVTVKKSKAKKAKAPKKYPPVPEAQQRPVHSAREWLDKPPPPNSAAKKALGPSAYGTALALMGPDPRLPLPELYDLMKDNGFDIRRSTGSIKTAHSIFRKVYRYLDAHGHINHKE